MAKASDNVFPKIIESMQTANPAAPSDSSWKIFAKADGIYARSSNTVVGPFGTSDLAGKELDYVQITGSVSITATTEGTANTIVTGSSVAYDGATVVLVEFFAPYFRQRSDGTAGNISVWLYADGSSIGQWGFKRGAIETGNSEVPVYLARRLTPSNASHTYSVRASVTGGTGNVGAGAGGSGNDMPAFIRITRVTS